jgi:eukaryotic-like serine/threonine-protein kinase
LLDLHNRTDSFIATSQHLGKADTVSLPESETAGSIFGHYKLLQEIGDEGMGTVFMAEQTKLVQRQVTPISPK